MENIYNRAKLIYNKNKAVYETLANGSVVRFLVVGVTGFEPAASTSQMSRATNCATPRNIYVIIPHLSLFVKGLAHKTAYKVC